MLHIHPDQATVTAAWFADGWPALVPWNSNLAAAPLYWLMYDLPAAVEAADWDIVDDFLHEASIWLDQLWRPTQTPGIGPHPAGDATAIEATLWGELQRGRGAQDSDHLAYHARLLAQLLAPADSALTLLRRPPAIPPYLPPDRRITGGRLPQQDLPHNGDANEIRRPEHEQFLLRLLTVLSNRTGGHLSDRAAYRCPPGAAPERTGWTRSGERPIGALLGSIDPNGNDLLLRPIACLAAVANPTGWTLAAIDDCLAAAWIVDTTLDTVSATRRSTVDRAVIDNMPPESLWQIPMAVFDPGQFFNVTLLRPRPRPRPRR